MRRTLHLIFVFLALVLFSCNGTEDNNRGLDYDFLDVSFTSSKAGGQWTRSDVVGIRATCTRDGKEQVLMSANDPARFVPVSEAEQAYLVKRSDDDRIIAQAGDHNYRFYAYTPYDTSIEDLSRLPADIPSEVRFGEALQNLYVASATVTGVVAPVALDFHGTSCLLNLQIPDDIVAVSNTVLQKMVIKASEGHELTGDIAYDATYDIYSGETTVTDGSGSKEITMLFGDDGCRLAAGYTSVSLPIAPFTVPEGGLSVEFTDVDGARNTMTLLTTQPKKT